MRYPVALVVTFGLVGLAAYSSRDRARVAELLKSSLVPWDQRPGLGVQQARLSVALVIFGVVAGIPLALGMAPGNAVVLAGALAACTIGRTLLRPGRPFAIGHQFLWLGMVAFCLVGSLLRFGSVEIGGSLAAQATLGPGPLLGELPRAAVSGAALILGTLSASFWLASLPNTGVDTIDRFFDWGAAALGGSAAAAPAWGPSLGAVFSGPIDLKLLLWVGASLAVTAGAVAFVSATKELTNKWARFALIPMAVLTGAVAVTAVLAR